MQQTPLAEHTRVKILSKERADFLNKLQHMTGREIRDKYNYSQNDIVSETIEFDDGTIKMDIRMSMPFFDSNTPDIRAILYDENGIVLCVDDDAQDIFDDWTMEFTGNDTYPAGFYTAILKADKNCETDSSSDNVNHPVHYQGKYECIDEMIALFGVDAVKNFCKCNVYKYRYRADRKNGQEDIAKAEWYMSKLMELEKK